MALLSGGGTRSFECDIFVSQASLASILTSIESFTTERHTLKVYYTNDYANASLKYVTLHVSVVSEDVSHPHYLSHYKCCVENVKIIMMKLL